jgi:hypothetical protein
VNGQAWPVTDGATLWLPAGAQAIQPGTELPALRVLDFNGDLKTARVLPEGGLELSYQSSSRALAVLNHAPQRIEIDGEAAQPRWLVSAGACTLYLPRGQHLVMIH